MTPSQPVEPRAQVSLPALLIATMGAVGALSALAGVITGVNADALEPALKALRPVPELAPVVHFFEAAPTWARPLNAVALTSSLLMALGGWRMRELKSYPLAVVGAVAAMLPLSGCCCLVGVPIGAWALTVLRRPEVRAAFD